MFSHWTSRQTQPQWTSKLVHRSRTKCRIHYPGHHTNAAHLSVWRSLEVSQQLLPTHELASLLQVPLDCLESFHFMPIPPDGLPEQDVAAIVQRTGDVQLRTTDRLIMIDILYHHHETRVYIQPTVVREAKRVGYQIIRPHLLLTAALFHYCQALTDHCEVFLDGVIWPESDHSPRPVEHGSYALIEVSPPAGYQVDTRLAVRTLQADGETDAFMQEFREMHQQNDFMQFTQITAKIHRRIPTRNSPHHLSKAIEVAGQLGAVLQSKTDLNPQCLENKTDTVCMVPSQGTVEFSSQKPHKVTCELQKNDATVQTPAIPVQTAKAADAGPLPLEVPCVQDFKASEKIPRNGSRHIQITQKQCTLHRYFAHAKTAQKTDPTLHRCTGQTTLHSFFPVKAPAEATPVDETGKREATDVTQDKQLQGHLQDVARLANDHIVSPPILTTSRPRLNGQERQQNPPRPAWLIHLDKLFEEMATTVHPETGPVLQVEVWYLHHDIYPECPAPRLVELDSIRELWYTDLCIVWLDHIARNQPLRVLNVMPTPPYQLRPNADVHVILEQGMDPMKAALHFTGARMGLFQRVESTSNRICTQDMIDRHGFQTQCNFRTCHMHSGRLRFMMVEREEIFSGMSAILTVGPVPTPHPAMDSDGRNRQTTAQEPEEEPDSDLISTMQINPAQTAERASPHNASRPSSTSRTDGTDPTVLSHRIPPHELSELRQTLLWHINTGPAACIYQMNAPVTVHTWFLDSLRVTHTDEYRTIQLQPQQHTWHRDILSRWQDKLDPTLHTQIHVVTPSLPEPEEEAAAHVILVQRPNDLWRAALLAVSVDHRPMDSTKYYCVMLDYETTVEQLGFMSLIKHPSNPQANKYWIQAKHGEIIIPDDATFPVRHGYSFELTAFRRDDPWEEETSLIQMQFAKIRKWIVCIHRMICHSAKEHMLNDPSSEVTVPMQPVSVEIDPSNGNQICDHFAALFFFATLQALWQPIALQAMPHTPPLVAIQTWYLDHIRYPQNFVSRTVLLPANPEEWIQRMRSVWHDVILPGCHVHFVIVQPDPPLLELTTAAHVLIVQQPISGFKATLFTVFDSAMPMQPRTRFASIAPSPLPQSTLLALAYRDIDCQQPTIDCSTWVGDEEILPGQTAPIIDGHSLAVAVHQHHRPGPDDAATWDHTQQPPNPRADPQTHLPPQEDHGHVTQDRRAASRASIAIQRNRTPVQLTLEAVLPAESTHADSALDDTLPQMLWFTDEAWLLRIQRCQPCTLRPLPEGLRLPDVCYWPLVHPVPPDPDSTSPLTLYLDGSANGTHAAWSVIATLQVTQSEQVVEAFIGCLYGVVQISPGHPTWVGAQTMDNIAAELSALAFAQQVALRWPHDHSICIRPDLSLSRLVATATTVCRSNQPLSQICRAEGTGWPQTPISRKLGATRALHGTSWLTQLPSGPCTMRLKKHRMILGPFMTSLLTNMMLPGIGCRPPTSQWKLVSPPHWTTGPANYAVGPEAGGQAHWTTLWRRRPWPPSNVVEDSNHLSQALSKAKSGCAWQSHFWQCGTLRPARNTKLFTLRK